MKNFLVLILSLLFLNTANAQTISSNISSLSCTNLSNASALCSSSDATNLTGTVASARISGSYTGITGIGTLTIGSIPTTLLTGALGNTQLTGVTLTGAKTSTTVVGSLPTCNGGTIGTSYVVTDALLPVALATVAGSGAIVVRVLCNGTIWIVD